jgi:hypothetical protein
MKKNSTEAKQILEDLQRRMHYCAGRVAASEAAKLIGFYGEAAEELRKAIDSYGTCVYDIELLNTMTKPLSPAAHTDIDARLRRVFSRALRVELDCIHSYSQLGNNFKLDYWELPLLALAIETAFDIKFGSRDLEMQSSYQDVLDTVSKLKLLGARR